jgi:hypothetical protein
MRACAYQWVAADSSRTDALTDSPRRLR